MAELQLDLGRRMSCDSAVLVGDWVYIRSDGVADLADASDPTKMPAVGFVSQKQGVDLAFVKSSGLYRRSPESWTPGTELYISETQPGRLRIGTPPTGTVQKAGDVDPDGITVIVNIDLTPEIDVSVVAGGEVIRSYAPGVLVRDVVYLRTDGVVDRASAASPVTIAGRGVVSSIDDPSPGLCKVLLSGDLTGFVGLSIGKTYIAGVAAGSIIAEDDILNPNYPDQTPSSGHVRAEIGEAAAADKLQVGTQRDYDIF